MKRPPTRPAPEPDGWGYKRHLAHVKNCKWCQNDQAWRGYSKMKEIMEKKKRL